MPTCPQLWGGHPLLLDSPNQLAILFILTNVDDLGGPTVVRMTYLVSRTYAQTTKCM